MKRAGAFFSAPPAALGMMALAHLLYAEGRIDPLAVKKPHFPGKAKNVIFLFMPGGPSQIDLLDPKPELQKWNGKPLPLSLTKDLKLAFIKPNANVVASPRRFARHGEAEWRFLNGYRTLRPVRMTCAWSAASPPKRLITIPAR